LEKNTVIERVRGKTAKKLIEKDVIDPIREALETLVLEREVEVLADEPIRYQIEKPKILERLAFRKKEMKESLERARNLVNEALDELQKRTDKSLRDNDGERKLQIILVTCLFSVGLGILAYAILQNMLATIPGAISEIAIILPLRNIRRIRDENTFLNALVPWIRTRIASCEAKLDLKDAASCYRDALKSLDEFMTKLQEKALD